MGTISRIFKTKHSENTKPGQRPARPTAVSTITVLARASRPPMTTRVRPVAVPGFSAACFGGGRARGIAGGVTAAIGRMQPRPLFFTGHQGGPERRKLAPRLQATDRRLVPALMRRGPRARLTSF